MEPKASEVWGRAASENAAALILAEIPDAQLPEPGKTVRATLGRRAHISRYVHFRRPDQPVQRAVWLFAVPAGHAYDFSPRTTVSALVCCRIRVPSSARVGRRRDDEKRGVTWKSHLDGRYEGNRLSLMVEPETDAPERVATKLASQVLQRLRRAGLIGAG